MTQKICASVQRVHGRQSYRIYLSYLGFQNLSISLYNQNILTSLYIVVRLCFDTRKVDQSINGIRKNYIEFQVWPVLSGASDNDQCCLSATLKYWPVLSLLSSTDRICCDQRVEHNWQPIKLHDKYYITLNDSGGPHWWATMVNHNGWPQWSAISSSRRSYGNIITFDCRTCPWTNPIRQFYRFKYHVATSVTRDLVTPWPQHYFHQQDSGEDELKLISQKVKVTRMTSTDIVCLEAPA